MSSSTRQPSFSGGRRAAVTAALADAALILAFAAIGRDAHQRGEIISGVLQTAWPFLAGAALAWMSGPVRRSPLSVRAGVVVWLGAVVGGMMLRAITGQTVVVAFVIVALMSLGLFLLGYRGLLALVRRLRKQSAA